MSAYRRHGSAHAWHAVCGACLAVMLVATAAWAQPEVAARFRQQKVTLLQEALKAAQAAGLDLLVEKITDQLAEASLQAGDLAGARAALLGIIERIESRREQLAFDPLLRQQWFADNIGPYRKLLRVAALQDDALLALSVAERMRSRALIDQLAWQKVDLELRLPDEIRQRLAALRQSREEAYGLLQWVLGGTRPDTSGGSAAKDGKESDTGTAAVHAGAGRGYYMPIRGMYMPIRGMYMPIRGPLDSGVVATEEDVKHLKELLAKLAQEEAALESAVREAVPAYDYATRTHIPGGEELAAALSEHPGLVVLEYTLSDDGLVLVTLREDWRPRVFQIAVTGDELWRRIGKFRELIWERKDEAFQEGAELFKLLVGPAAGWLESAKRVWVIAEGALQLLPFSALLDSDGVFLGWKVPLASAPSLSLALGTRGNRPTATQGPLIVAAPDTGALELGAPDKTTQSPAEPNKNAQTATPGRGYYMPIRGMYMPIRGMYMPIRGEGNVSTALTAMAAVPLPGARAEGEVIAGQLEGARLLVGKEATKERLLTEGSNSSVLHIACHGYADPDFPEFSGLLLAGSDEQPYEVLTASEVYGWPLQARLVTLSACQTALGKDVQGEGLLGLTRAFIYAGAQDVLCSLWPVSDESTKILMAWLYDGLNKGLAVDEALQSAQKVLMAYKETNHPFFWAGFSLVRGPE